MHIGPHINAFTPGVLGWCISARPSTLKTLDPNAAALQCIKAAVPDCFVVYRRYVDMDRQKLLLVNPTGGAYTFADEVLRDLDKIGPYVDAVEGLNEIGLWEEADLYNLWTAEFGRIMQRHGVKTIAYNFAVGTPPGYFTGDGNLYPDLFKMGLKAYWAHYLDGLRESTYLGLHEYGAPTMQTDASWLCLRYRRVWDVLPEDARRLIIITECGLDTGVMQPPVGLHGWRWLGLTEEQYVAQLRWYASEIAKDDYVVGAHVYQAGASDPAWATFNIAGCEQIAAMMAEREDTMDPEIQAKIDQLLQQNTLITEGFKRLRKGRFTGADGLDGIIVALQGGNPLDFFPNWPPKNL